MQTSGYRNDTPMTLTPVAVTLAVGVVLFRGPTAGLEAVNQLARDLASRGCRSYTGCSSRRRLR